MELVQSVEGLASLGAEWDELLAENGASSVALTHRWQLRWWQIFQARRRLCVIAVRESGGRLVGVAPLLLRNVRHRGLIPFRRLELLATGEDEADEIDSDYLDFILRPGWERSALESIFGYLLRQASFRWDELILRRLPEDSATIALCRRLAESWGLKIVETDRHAGVVVHLPGSWTEYLTRFSHKSRYNLRRERKLLGESGDVQFRWTRTADEFESLWPTLVDLHQRRWQMAGKPGCFSSEPFTAFHRRLAQDLSPRGAARIAVLCVNRQPVAVRYQFVWNGTVFDYQSGQEPAGATQLSPGNVLAGYCVEAAIAEGFKTYDFLRGVSAYKQTWSKDLRHQVSLRLSRPGFREGLRSWIEASVWRAKEW